MAIAINGKNSPAAISYNGHDISEVYVGSRKVWPDENEFYVRTRLSTQQGYDEWTYYSSGSSFDINAVELETGDLCSGITLSGYTKLRRLKLSDSTKVLGNMVDLWDLTDVDLGNGLESVNGYYWTWEGGEPILVSMTLPASIKHIDGRWQIKTMRVLAATPPTIGDYFFEVTITDWYVPAESFDLYKVAPKWDNIYSRGCLHPIE